DFLAGVNGTGKSTVLHLLGRLFAQLQTENYYFPIPVTLIFVLQVDGNQERQITVSNIFDEEEQSDTNLMLRYKEADQEWQTGKIPSDLLPHRIVIYTTGSEAAWLQELLEPNVVETAVPGAIPEDEEAEAYLQEL